MLKKLTIKNFKAIQEMTIEFTPMTVLIGENNCGKSTVLQAIDLLRSAAFRDIPEYLREKDWKLIDIKSQYSKGSEKPIELISTWDFLIKNRRQTIEWFLSLDIEKGWVIKERLTNCNENKVILSYHNKDQEDNPASLGELNIQSSALKFIAGTSKNTDEIEKLFFFLSDSACFEVLSPEKIRSGKKQPYIQNIGAGGENMAYCIHKMNDAEKKHLNKKVSDIIETPVEILTYDLGNKIELYVKFKDNETTVESTHVSDGLLRIIAFATILMEKKNILPPKKDDAVFVKDVEEKYVSSVSIPVKSMILLDEIENGINPYKTEPIISLLREILEKNERQVIVTTHSPVMLDDFQPEEIVFLWKDENNSVHAKKFFDNEEMKSLLEAFYPGEVWVNLDKEEILERLSLVSEDK